MTPGEQELEKLKCSAAAYCATAERCVSDVRAKLERSLASEEQQQTVIDYLVKQGYLDESRYARAFVHDKFRFAGWGRIKIRYALRMKNVPDAAISEALASIDEEDYQSRLKSILQAKKQTLSGDDYAVRGKLMRFAASRGFEMDAVIRVMG